MTHEVPALPYEYNALEPFIDEQTMTIHHDKHHAGYVNNLNKALEAHPELAEKSVAELLADLNSLPEDVRTAIRNNGGGHWNHSFFWPLLKKDVPAKGALVDAITAQWGSLDAFKEAFAKSAATRFGSGWAWLVKVGDKLAITSTANQDCPLSEGQTPIIGLDVWEHAYYLKYQNKRPDYITAFWSVLNWEQAEENFKNAS